MSTVAKITQELGVRLGQDGFEITRDFNDNVVMNLQDAQENLDTDEYDVIEWSPASPEIGAPRPKKPR